MKRLFLLVLLGSACATATGDATKIRVTSDPGLVRDCVRLGEVRGSGAWGNPFNEVERSGENAMRKKAARMGGDTVLITYQTRTGSAGEVYRCSQAK
jgi:Domain of unknown function (DUF4156)